VLAHAVDIAPADNQDVQGREVVIWSADPMARADLAERMLARGKEAASVCVVQTQPGWSIVACIREEPQTWTYDALNKLVSTLGVLIVAQPMRGRTITAWSRKVDEWRKVIAKFVTERPNRNNPKEWNPRAKHLELVTVHGLLEKAFGIPPSQFKRSEEMIVSKILKSSGWEKIRPYKADGRIWAYKRPRGRLKWG
jgi:hypothetical protein